MSYSDLCRFGDVLFRPGPDPVLPVISINFMTPPFCSESSVSDKYAEGVF